MTYIEIPINVTNLSSYNVLKQALMQNTTNICGII